MGAGEVVVEHPGGVACRTDDTLVDPLFQSVPPSPESVHGPVELVIVDPGGRDAREEGGGRARHPIQEAELAGRVVEPMEHHKFERAGQPTLGRDPVERLVDGAAEPQLTPQEVAEGHPTVLPGPGDAQIGEGRKGHRGRAEGEGNGT